MSTSFTYNSLVAALQTTTEENGSEYLAFIPTIIQLAEDKILRDLDLELFDTITPLAFTAGNPLLTKPTGTIATRTIHYVNASNNRTLLELRSWEYVNDYWPNPATTTATPKYFAEYSATQWHIAGTPTGTNAVYARCVVRPTGLAVGNQNTWLSNYMGDLMLLSCLVSSEQYLKADNRIPVWKSDYTERLAAARVELRQEDRVDYTPMTTNTDREEA